MDSIYFYIPRHFWTFDLRNGGEDGLVVRATVSKLGGANIIRFDTQLTQRTFLLSESWQQQWRCPG